MVAVGGLQVVSMRGLYGGLSAPKAACGGGPG